MAHLLRALLCLDVRELVGGQADTNGRPLSAVVHAAALNPASAVLLAADLSCPLSNAAKTSFSYAFIFGIAFTLNQIIPRHPVVEYAIYQ